jgi:hypothetical protein
MKPLVGRFAIQTDLKLDFITVVDGGGKITDVIHTDAFDPRAWEQFTFWADSATGQWFAFQTETGNFITAVDAGGRITDTIHSDATIVSTWEMFHLLRQSAFPNFAIQTLRGFFLTATGGGGHNSGDTIHTDALQALEWERFRLLRRLDFGTGSTYALQVWPNPNNPVSPFGPGPYLSASNGGGPGSEFLAEGGASFQMSWTLLKQDDGTYAFQSASGKVLTAVDGGLPGPNPQFTIDTPPDQIGNFEKFTIIDNGVGSNFTSIVKTFSGTYLSFEVPQINPLPLVITVDNAEAAMPLQFQLLKL